MTTSVNLPDSLLLLLDGKGDDKLQKQVDAAKDRALLSKELPALPNEQLKFISDVVALAKNDGRLSFQWKHLTSCCICKTRPGYVKFKSGPRKGRDNTDRPLSLAGVDLKSQFVNWQGHANLGCCTDCWSILKPILVEKLHGVEAEIPKHITGHDPLFKRHDLRHCKKCGWTGSERLMGKTRTLMGDGYYPSTCPECEAKNSFLGPTVIESAPGFEIYKLP